MVDQNKPGTFIPHDAAAPAPRQQRTSGLNDLLLLCAIVLLVASGALAVGVFLYNQFLQSESASKLAQLQRAEAAFEPSLIEQITRLDDRMNVASQLLGAHLAPTVFFGALDQMTLQTVSFQSLDLETPDPQHITIKMQGVAQSVNSIALESDLLSQSGIISSPIFSNIARQPDGVHFDLTASVNPSPLNYEDVLDGTTASSTTVQTPPTTSAAPASPFGDLPTAPQSATPSSGTTQSATATSTP